MSDPDRLVWGEYEWREPMQRGFALTLGAGLALWMLYEGLGWWK